MLPLLLLSTIAAVLELTCTPAAANVSGNDRFRGTFSKLYAFALPARRVLFLDSDTLTTAPLDGEFRARLAGAPDVPPQVWCHAPRLQLPHLFHQQTTQRLGRFDCNTGFFVVQPSNHTLRAGLQMLKAQAFRKHLKHSEQLFLDDLFQRQGITQWLLPSHFGAALKQPLLPYNHNHMAFRAALGKRRNPEDEMDAAVIVHHWAGGTKPWQGGSGKHAASTAAARLWHASCEALLLKLSSADHEPPTHAERASAGSSDATLPPLLLTLLYVSGGAVPLVATAVALASFLQHNPGTRAHVMVAGEECTDAGLRAIFRRLGADVSCVPFLDGSSLDEPLAATRPVAMRTDAPVRVGVLSAAKSTRSVLATPAAQAGVAIVALAARDPAAAREAVRALGLPPSHALGTYEELLASADVEAAYIPLPNALHLRWVEKALAEGKHVLVEKPLALNGDEAVRMVRLARARGLVLMEGYHSFHHPFFDRLRALLPALGALETISVSFTLARGKVDPLTNNRYSYSLGGGSTLDLGGYVLGVMRALTGEPPKVEWARAETWPRDARIDEAVTGAVSFPGLAGANGSFQWTFLAKQKTKALAHVTVTGSSGKLVGKNFVCPQFGGTISVWRRAPHGRVPRGARPQVENFSAKPSTYALQLRTFAQAVRMVQRGERRADSFPHTGQAIIEFARMLDAVYERAGMQQRGKGGVGQLRDTARPLLLLSAAAAGDDASRAADGSPAADATLAAAVACLRVAQRQPGEPLVRSRHQCAGALGLPNVWAPRAPPESVVMVDLGTDGRETWAPAAAALYEQHGYLLAKNALPRAAALELGEAFAAVAASGALHSFMYDSSQPHRSKSCFGVLPAAGGGRHCSYAQAHRHVLYERVVAHSQRLLRLVALLHNRSAANEPFNAATDYLARLLAHGLSVRLNIDVNQPGSAFQNPHWDVINCEAQGRIYFVQIPLVPTTMSHGPLEWWPQTHRLHYRSLDALEPQHTAFSMRLAGSLQFNHCLPVMQRLGRCLPSHVLVGEVGSAMIRTPAMFHRGTPNVGNVVRPQVTIVIKARGGSRRAKCE